MENALKWIMISLPGYLPKPLQPIGTLAAICLLAIGLTIAIQCALAAWMIWPRYIIQGISNALF